MASVILFFFMKVFDFVKKWWIFIQFGWFSLTKPSSRELQIHENQPKSMKIHHFFTKSKKNMKKKDKRCQKFCPSFFDQKLALCRKWNRAKVLSRSWRKTVAPCWRGPTYRCGQCAQCLSLQHCACHRRCCCRHCAGRRCCRSGPARRPRYPCPSLWKGGEA